MIKTLLDIIAQTLIIVYGVEHATRNINATIVTQTEDKTDFYIVYVGRNSDALNQTALQI